jgi:hypothetical protein
MEFKPTSVEETVSDLDVRRDLAQRAAARDALFSRLDTQPAMNLSLTWTRDDLYER